MNEHILVVEDDTDIRELVELYIRNSGYDTTSVDNGTDAMKLVETQQVDAVLLDIMLPDVDGIVVCRKMKDTADVPVILFSCKRSPEDIISGLDVADDYVTKPFNPEVLLARVRLQLRKAEQFAQAYREANVYTFGDLVIDTRKMEVIIDETPLQLFSKEYQLLLFFATHPNQTYSAAQLHDVVWGKQSKSDERTVLVHIHNLRRKLQNTSARDYIRTVRGEGYQFVPELMGTL